MMTSILSRETITYILAPFVHAHFASTSPFKESHKNPQFFMCISPQFWRPEHQFYSKTNMRTSLLSPRVSRYTHTIFSRSFLHLQTPFLGIAQISQFFVFISPWIWHRSTQTKFSKKLYEDLYIIFVTITCTHTYFFTSISSSTDLF